MPVPSPAAVSKAAKLQLGQEMLGLYKMLDAMLPELSSRFIQFIGATPGEGTSTIVREFAQIAANQIGASVLLLDADRIGSNQNQYFKLQADLGWIDAIKQGVDIENALHRVGQSNLFLSPSSNAAGFTPEIFNSPVFDKLCASLRHQFDWILIDSAPFTRSPDGLAIASKVDGVVLVIEAEKTKWQVIKDLKESISRVGGTTLGVVLNKRKFYIPHYIYKYL